MSEDRAETTGWLISVRGWQTMATRPQPFFARNKNERDWYLKNSLDPDAYDVEPATDPYTPAKRTAVDAWCHAPTVGPMP